MQRRRSRYSWISVNVGLLTSSGIDPEPARQPAHERGLPGAESPSAARPRPARSAAAQTRRAAAPVSSSDAVLDAPRSSSSPPVAARGAASSQDGVADVLRPRSPAVIETSPSSVGGQVAGQRRADRRPGCTRPRHRAAAPARPQSSRSARRRCRRWPCPGLPVGLMKTVPVRRGDDRAVPLEDDVQPVAWSRTSRAIRAGCACTSLVGMPSSRAISPGCGVMMTSGPRAPTSRPGSPANALSASASSTSGTCARSTSPRTNAATPSPAPRPGPDGDHVARRSPGRRSSGVGGHACRPPSRRAPRSCTPGPSRPPSAGTIAAWPPSPGRRPTAARRRRRGAPRRVLPARAGDDQHAAEFALVRLAPAGAARSGRSASGVISAGRRRRAPRSRDAGCRCRRRRGRRAIALAGGSTSGSFGAPSVTVSVRADGRGRSLRGCRPTGRSAGRSTRPGPARVDILDDLARRPVSGADQAGAEQRVETTACVWHVRGLSG